MTRVEGQAARAIDDEARLTCLAAEASHGNEAAFAELYGLLSQRIFNLVLRSVHDRPTAEDLCQEIWLKAHREIRELRTPAAVCGWLYRLASRACIDFSRSSRGKHRGEEDDITDLVVAHGLQPEDAAIVAGDLDVVWETLGAMPPRQSLALYLKQVAGLSYAEISAVLGCPPPAVEALLFRARQNFTRAHARLESSVAERCGTFSQVMASVIDNEPTPLQRSALEAHAGACLSCRRLLREAREANRAYLALPFLPAGEGLALQTILVGGGAAAGGGLLTATAGLVGAGTLQAKLVFVGVILVALGVAGAGQIGEPAASNQPLAAAINPAATFSGDETSELAAAAGPIATGPEGDAPTPGGTAGRDAGTAPPANGRTEGPFDHTVAVARTEIGGSSRGNGSPTTSAPSVHDADPPAGLAPSQPGTGGTTAGSAPPDLPPASEASGAGPGDGSGPADAGEVSAAAQGPVGTLLDLTDGVTGGVTDLASEIVNQTPPGVGDIVNAVAAPVATVVQPVDQAVADLTGLSLVETVDDATNLLPSSDSTAVPLDAALQDVVEPVDSLLMDPLEPVQTPLVDPLQPLATLTEPLLSPDGLAPDATPAPETPPAVTPTPDEGSCLLGLLLC